MQWFLNPYRPDPEGREKNLNKFLFSHFFVVHKNVLQGLKGLHKTFWDATKKRENKNLTYFYFNITFRNAWDVKG